MRLSDRRPLGRSGLSVSPLCLGLTGDPATVEEAYQAGVNFFFLSADLHWPAYEATRQGLSRLLLRRKVRDEIVVGVVSYLAEPLFGVLQFHEVIAAVPGLERVDLLIAGAVSSDEDCYPRLAAVERALQRRHCGARAGGATFHSRWHALAVGRADAVDVGFVRYNPRHRGASQDLFPYLPPQRRGLLYGFKSTAFHVGERRLAELRLPAGDWRPGITDSYRFALSQRRLDGVLASPASPRELLELGAALERGPLSDEEEAQMVALADRAHASPTAG
jgi:hypothetical protein